MTEEDFVAQKLMASTDEFAKDARAELQARWSAWPLDLTKPQLHEVVGGLMARQVALAVQLAGSPAIWNGDVAPLMLRAMADVYITLAWILEKPEERCDRYVKYGLGQRKLWIEHVKADLSARGVKEVSEHPWVKAATEQLNAERFEHLIEVSIGNWSDTDTRKMAEEAGCLDLYRFAYGPFSGAVHSMWQHVVAYNLERCQNPLHQNHRVPVVRVHSVDADYLFRAAKYLEKTFSLFDRKTGVVVETPSAFSRFTEALSAMGAELSDVESASD